MKRDYFLPDGPLRIPAILFVFAVIFITGASGVGQTPEEQLAAEVHGMGWICYAARSSDGDWDLFLCRPDGTDVRALTSTPGFNEFYPQFSRDSKRLLYRRIKRDEVISGNNYGMQGELVVADADGSNPRVMGGDGELPWASWSPDGSQVACLSLKGIALVDLATDQISKTLPRKGFFQQTIWSPDGEWLLGVANAFGTGWSIARMNLESGEAEAVNRVDCCTPDWYPDGRKVIFSWRPPGQGTNNGLGWTQLWTIRPDGQGRQLVFAEDNRHVYGGNVSPDGQYVVFTGNIEEDGDPGHSGAPMALMRLSNAPIIAGASPAIRKAHPEANNGPLLTLPEGWEPCWTGADIGAGKGASFAEFDAVSALADELKNHGWLVFSDKMPDGNWDLFLMRPDGSQRHAITNTPEFNEAGGRFSPDGTRLLYFRMPVSTELDNNSYGTHELVISDSNGAHPVSYGEDLPWASWSRDDKRVACLFPRGIEIIDLQTREVLRKIPRQGMVQQMFWAPDGSAVVATTNGLGPYWTIGCMHLDHPEIIAVSETDRYNCTPDWYADSKHILYSRGIIPDEGGRAEMWLAMADGSGQRMLYAENGNHVYGTGCSPDGQYLVFTRSKGDLGGSENPPTTMAIIRMRDAPILGDDAPKLRAAYPDAASGPRLDLGPGWEPGWTYSEAPAKPLSTTTN